MRQCAGRPPPARQWRTPGHRLWISVCSTGAQSGRAGQHLGGLSRSTLAADRQASWSLPFGHPAELDSLVAIARKNNLIVIEDCSQSPTALYKDRFAGTIGHIGILSLNYHKHIHTGEGGICLTDDAVLAERMQLIRNHAESVLGTKGYSNKNELINLIDTILENLEEKNYLSDELYSNSKAKFYLKKGFRTEYTKKIYIKN